MDSVEESEEFDRTLLDLNLALDVLTDTLGGVAGCEYPRLLAREIQSLIKASIAHENVRHPQANFPRKAELPAPVLANPARADDDTIRLMAAALEARDAEISRLVDLLRHGIDTIEAHTLTDAEGTAVLHEEYQCISAAAIEQWMGRVETVLDPAGRSSERNRRVREELRGRLNAPTAV